MTKYMAKNRLGQKKILIDFNLMTKYKIKKMRRSTHAICRNCFQVLEEYTQVRCVRCLIKFDDSRVSFSRHSPLPFGEKLACFFESLNNRCALKLTMFS